MLLQKQSDLGLPCLSMPFLQASSIQNFRTFSVNTVIESLDSVVGNLKLVTHKELSIALIRACALIRLNKVSCHM